MPTINCPIDGCAYNTGDVEASIAAALLMVHNNIHVATTIPARATTQNKQKAPKINRPTIRKGSSEEIWNAFLKRWQMFKVGTALQAEESVQQLFQCCEDELGDEILKSYPNAVSGTEEILTTAIKTIAVTPVAISVCRAELLSIKQDHGESTRSFFARINGKAATCAYTIDCSSNTCNQKNDFTDIMVKDVLITGLSDDDVKKEVLGWAELDEKSVQNTVKFIESKEMARDALAKQSVAGVSSYKEKQKGDQKAKILTKCKDCNTEMEKFAWNKRQHKMIECSVCLKCWRNNRKNAPAKSHQNEVADETSALLIGAAEMPQESMSSLSCPTSSEIILGHHIFDSSEGWKKAESMQHPTLKLRMSVDVTDYEQVGAKCPNTKPSHVSAVTDTGAQSCLWGLQDFLNHGFKKSDLIPVKRTLLAANREAIEISGAV